MTESLKLALINWGGGIVLALIFASLIHRCYTMAHKEVMAGKQRLYNDEE